MCLVDCWSRVCCAWGRHSLQRTSRCGKYTPYESLISTNQYNRKSGYRTESWKEATQHVDEYMTKTDRMYLENGPMHTE